MMCGVSTAAVCLDLSCADTVAYPERVMLTDTVGGAGIVRRSYAGQLRRCATGPPLALLQVVAHAQA